MLKCMAWSAYPPVASVLLALDPMCWPPPLLVTLGGESVNLLTLTKPLPVTSVLSPSLLMLLVVVAVAAALRAGVGDGRRLGGGWARGRGGE